MLHDAPARVGARRIAVVGWSLLIMLGVSLLVAALLGAAAPARLPDGVGLDGVGAAVVAVGYAWGLFARAGGQPWIGTLLAAAVSVAALGAGTPELRGGAAVMTAVLGAVLGVLATRPAVTFLRALGEVVLALGIAAIGGMAAVGFRPTVDLARFEYLVLGLSFLLLVALVHRLGAGLHGLGTRGLVVVAVGLVVVSMTLAYTELLRRYGTPGVTSGLGDLVASSRDVLGGFPRPLQALLGIPALVWGCHLRARRRQGWWRWWRRRRWRRRRRRR